MGLEADILEKVCSQMPVNALSSRNETLDKVESDSMAYWAEK